MDKEEDFQHFMTRWFTGLLNGLESIDQDSREAVLRACGKACAASHTAQVFQDTRQHSANLDSFLTNLSHKFPEATYERISQRKIRVTYTECACDLVKRGFTRSPMLCQCSAFNLQANFEQALQTPVEVTVQSSILHNDEDCTFVVTFQDNIRPLH